MNADIENLKSTTFANKRFTRKQLSRIQQTVSDFPNLSRRELGHTICEHIQWLTPTGSHKIQACLSALEEMEEIGLFTLPGKRKIEKKGLQKEIAWTEKTEGHLAINCRLKDLPAIRIQRVTTKEEIDLWNEYIDRYHYLKYRKPIGTHSRYLSFRVKINASFWDVCYFPPPLFTQWHTGINGSAGMKKPGKNG